MFSAKLLLKRSTTLMVALAICTAEASAATEVRRTTPLLCGSISTSDVATMQLTTAELQALADRDIVLIVDKSASMASRDCPAPPSKSGSKMTAFELIAANIARPISRWDWCFREVGGLVEQLHLVSRRGLTVVMFDSEYVSHQYYRAEEVVRSFENARPSGRTELAPALRSQITSYYARCWGALPAKPLSIAVLTDGCAGDPNEVRKTIIEASRAAQLPDDIQILFVNVGRGDKGTRFLTELDEQLLVAGAKFDIVRCESFADVAKDGLGRKLARIAMTAKHSQF